MVHSAQVALSVEGKQELEYVADNLDERSKQEVLPSYSAYKKLLLLVTGTRWTTPLSSDQGWCGAVTIHYPNTQHGHPLFGSRTLWG